MAQTDVEPAAFRSSLKKTIFSDVDQLRDPNFAPFTSSLDIKDKLIMFNDQRLKQGGEYKHLGDVSKPNQWKPSIK